MARAERIPGVVVSPPPDMIRLELTLDEAGFLADMLKFVSGSPTASRRRHADKMSLALRGAGVHSALAYAGVGGYKDFLPLGGSRGFGFKMGDES